MEPGPPFVLFEQVNTEGLWGKIFFLETVFCPGAPCEGACEFCPGPCETEYISYLDLEDDSKMKRACCYEEAREHYKYVVYKRMRIRYWHIMREMKQAEEERGKI